MGAQFTQSGAPPASWLLTAQKVAGAVTETANVLSLIAPYDVRYASGGPTDTLPAKDLATIYGASVTQFDSTAKVYLAITVVGSDVLQVVAEADLGTVAGDYAILASIYRNAIREYQQSGPTGSGDPLQLEAGAVNVTIPSGDSIATQPVTFPLPYTSAPIVVCTGYKDIFVAGIHDASITTTGFTATAATRDAANVGSDTVVPLLWHACLPTPEAPAHSWTGQAASTGTPFALGGGGAAATSVNKFWRQGALPSSGNKQALVSFSGTVGGQPVWGIVYLDDAGGVYLHTRPPGGSATTAVKINPAMGAVVPGDWYWLSLSTLDEYTFGDLYNSYDGFCAKLTHIADSATDGEIDAGLNTNVNPYTLNADVAFGTNITPDTGYVDSPDTAGYEQAKGSLYVSPTTPSVNSTPYTALVAPPTSDTMPSADYLGLWLVNAGELAGVATQLADDNASFTTNNLGAAASLTLRTPSPY